MPGCNQRRNDEAVNHHVHAVQRPAKEGRNQSATFWRCEIQYPELLLGKGYGYRLVVIHRGSPTASAIWASTVLDRAHCSPRPTCKSFKSLRYPELPAGKAAVSGESD